MLTNSKAPWFASNNTLLYNTLPIHPTDFFKPCMSFLEYNNNCIHKYMTFNTAILNNSTEDQLLADLQNTFNVPLSLTKSHSFKTQNIPRHCLTEWISLLYQWPVSEKLIKFSNRFKFTNHLICLRSLVGLRFYWENSPWYFQWVNCPCCQDYIREELLVAASHGVPDVCRSFLHGLC